MKYFTVYLNVSSQQYCAMMVLKVHIFWESHKFLQNLHHRFVLCSNGQIYGGDFAKFCGLLRIYELYKLFSRHSWYIAIAHIHFFWSACKARNFNPISRVEIAWLVCWWCDGWRSQYSARLVSKIYIKYKLEIKTSCLSFCSRIW